MKNKKPGNKLFCLYGDCGDFALYGDYCLKHEGEYRSRAEAAEARAADFERKWYASNIVIAQLEDIVADLQARLDVMRDKYIAQVVATDNMVKENTKLRAELKRAQREYEKLQEVVRGLSNRLSEVMP